MYDAQTINCYDDTATELYSPWFPRGGDYGLLTVELIAASDGGSLTLTVQMVDKNSDDAGDGQNVGSSFSRTGAQAGTRESADITAGFEELVRYKFTLSHSSASAGAQWATFRMLAPTWYDKV